SEAAWQLARADCRVRLYEMRPVQKTEAHQSARLGELVCSNSFRSDNAERSAIGLLHEEMRRLGSLVLSAADANKLPAGEALAVDREGFAQAIEDAIDAEPLIAVRREEVASLPSEDNAPVIVATGPLTSSSLARSIQEATGEDGLAFFDAIAPIVYRDSIDLDVAWFQSRYDKEGPGGDKAAYINCPLDKQQYDAFIDELIAAETTAFKEWERATPYFEGCLPIEVMAERGRDTPRYGPMKPVGLTNPHAPAMRAHAVVQLRQDNALGTLYNIVGFQTKLKYAEQKRLFRMIPGLENARFARLGGIHRNSFINAPKLLDPWLRLKARPHIRFAGQITGVEGYVESAAIGLIAGRFLADDLEGREAVPPPPTTAMGAILGHITRGGDAASFQPMNANFGLFPPLDERLHKKQRKAAYAERARADLTNWLNDISAAAA
ncbi:MAG: methylenetetrahydrofolate--tRNA-(uracil(54)-C(5))-methyltransferase (FADH(2)-oxidizing) TrmFO, partial [Proteobacteria bacterium]|nr:methylenetetrahydrofolate--tRNA-(uracil(54)-C(5))-methyltransferase (FADH(2)-oxidizing) TrmFO [Pseudomonadota bacterium]